MVIEDLQWLRDLSASLCCNLVVVVVVVEGGT